MTSGAGVSKEEDQEGEEVQVREEEEEEMKKGKKGREEIGTRQLRRGSGWLSPKNPRLLISGL